MILLLDLSQYGYDFYEMLQSSNSCKITSRSTREEIAIIHIIQDYMLSSHEPLQSNPDPSQLLVKGSKLVSSAGKPKSSAVSCGWAGNG